MLSRCFPLHRLNFDSRVIISQILVRCGFVESFRGRVHPMPQSDIRWGPDGLWWIRRGILGEEHA